MILNLKSNGTHYFTLQCTHIRITILRNQTQLIKQASSDYQ